MLEWKKCGSDGEHSLAGIRAGARAGLEGSASQGGEGLGLGAFHERGAQVAERLSEEPLHGLGKQVPADVCRGRERRPHGFRQRGGRRGAGSAAVRKRENREDSHDHIVTGRCRSGAIANDAGNCRL